MVARESQLALRRFVLPTLVNRPAVASVQSLQQSVPFAHVHAAKLLMESPFSSNSAARKIPPPVSAPRRDVVRDSNSEGAIEIFTAAVLVNRVVKDWVVLATIAR